MRRLSPKTVRAVMAVLLAAGLVGSIAAPALADRHDRHWRDHHHPAPAYAYGYPAPPPPVVYAPPPPPSGINFIIPLHIR